MFLLLQADRTRASNSRLQPHSKGYKATVAHLGVKPGAVESLPDLQGCCCCRCNLIFDRRRFGCNMMQP